MSAPMLATVIKLAENADDAFQTALEAAFGRKKATDQRYCGDKKAWPPGVVDAWERKRAADIALGQAFEASRNRR